MVKKETSPISSAEKKVQFVWLILLWIRQERSCVDIANQLEDVPDWMNGQIKMCHVMERFIRSLCASHSFWNIPPIEKVGDKRKKWNSNDAIFFQISILNIKSKRDRLIRWWLLLWSRTWFGTPFHPIGRARVWRSIRFDSNTYVCTYFQ